MNNNQIIEMLKELIMELDYDIYKDIFVYKEDETDIPDLIKIVKTHMGHAKHED